MNHSKQIREEWVEKTEMINYREMEGCLVDKNDYPLLFFDSLIERVSSISQKVLLRVVTFPKWYLPDTYPGGPQFNTLALEKTFSMNINFYLLKIKVNEWRIYLITYLIDRGDKSLIESLINNIKTDKNLIISWNKNFGLEDIINFLTRKYNTLIHQTTFEPNRKVKEEHYNSIISILKEEKSQVEETEAELNDVFLRNK